MSALDVVIVHYHAAQATLEAIDALRCDAHASSLPIRIVIADNGSAPEERELLDSSGAEVVATGRNAGYAGAINAVVPSTRAECVIVMNEDVLVQRGCLRALHDALASGAAVAGPKFFWDLDRTILLPCTEERTRANEWAKVEARHGLAQIETARRRWRVHARRHWNATAPMRSTSLSGALLAFRRDAWAVIGPFDEGFQLYYEENDWLLRAEAAGCAPWYVPDAEAVHLHNPFGGNVAQRSAWEAESFVRFGTRYYGEEFMQRLLLASRDAAVVPQWPQDEPIAVSANTARPLWLELSPSVLGFPAAAMRSLDEMTAAALPTMRGLEQLTGTLYLQVVDDEGRELARHAAAPGPSPQPSPRRRGEGAAESALFPLAGRGSG